jgi:hypothetical protein
MKGKDVQYTSQLLTGACIGGIWTSIAEEHGRGQAGFNAVASADFHMAGESWIFGLQTQEDHVMVNIWHLNVSLAKCCP